MNFIVKIRSKCGQGGSWSKNLKILRISYLEAPLVKFRATALLLQRGSKRTKIVAQYKDRKISHLIQLLDDMG